MFNYLVTFEIRNDDSSRDRFVSFRKALLYNCTGYWEGTSSTFIISTEETIDYFCSRIAAQSVLDMSKDMFLVLDTSQSSGRAKGNVVDRDLFALLPFVTEI